MYVSWKGYLASGVVGTLAGAGVGFACAPASSKGKHTAIGAGIGLGAGLALPAIADGVTGLGDENRADLVIGLKDLRAAIKDGKAVDVAKAKDMIMAAVQKSELAEQKALAKNP